MTIPELVTEAQVRDVFILALSNMNAADSEHYRGLLKCFLEGKASSDNTLQNRIVKQGKSYVREIVSEVLNAQEKNLLSLSDWKTEVEGNISKLEQTVIKAKQTGTNTEETGSRFYSREEIKTIREAEGGLAKSKFILAYIMGLMGVNHPVNKAVLSLEHCINTQVIPDLVAKKWIEKDRDRIRFARAMRSKTDFDKLETFLSQYGVNVEGFLAFANLWTRGNGNKTPAHKIETEQQLKKFLSR